MKIIETHGLKKSYDESVTAIDGLDLSIEEGEIYGFLGPNGAGKTTTINLLLNYLKPTAGRAEIFGYDVQQESDTIRRRIGVLPEGASPYPRLNTYEHLELIAELNDVDEDFDAIRERVGLSEDEANRRAEQYSKGMKKRLGLGMALVGNPDLLILDEPSAGLDPVGMKEIRELIQEEAAKGTAVFFSSHLLGEVESVCDRIGMLYDGQIIEEDAPSEIRAKFSSSVDVDIFVESVPDHIQNRLEDVNGVSDVTVKRNMITVACMGASVKIDAIRTVDQYSQITDVISENIALEAMFHEILGEDNEENEIAEESLEVER